MTFAGIQKVFSVKDNKAVEKTVVVGKRDGDWVSSKAWTRARQSSCLQGVSSQGNRS